MNYKELDLTASSRPEAEANMKLHIEALRELAHAFVKEVEDLGTEAPAPASDNLSFYDEVRRFEINLICRALIRTGGQQKRAARMLGVKATTLNSKIKRYRIACDSPRNLRSAMLSIDASKNAFDNKLELQAMR
jgi:transcriptional regulator with GAF, ATPase, and Fis domain